MTVGAKPLLLEEILQGGVLTLRLGGGRAHPLGLAMINALQAALDRAATSPDIRVVVIDGPGHIFCAGHDLKEIVRHRTDADNGLAYLRDLFARCARLMQTLTHCPRPTIAMVGGIATAGGLQLVASCDLAFAGDKASFSLPGVQNGGFCTTPLVAVGRAIARKRALEMAMSGASYDAEWALDSGLVSRVLPDADLADFTNRFATGLARHRTQPVGLGKQCFHKQIELPLDAAYAQATEVMLGHFMDPARIERDQDRWS